MIYIKNQVFIIQRILLLAIGLWPYNQSKLARLQSVVFFWILVSCVALQLTAFLISKCTLDLIIKVFSIELIYIAFVTSHNWLRLNIQTVKRFLEYLQLIYHDEMQDENEIAILKRYGSKAKRYTARLTQFMLLGISCLILPQYWPHAFDAVIPLRISRERFIMFLAEYIPYRGKYFYLIILHINVAAFLGTIVVTLLSTTINTVAQHVCGMFRVTSYRIEKAMTILKDDSPEKENAIFKEITYAVDLHQKAMNLCEALETSYSTIFYFLTIDLVISLSLNLFRLFQALSVESSTGELVLLIVIVICHFAFIFLANYISQEIMDHNNNIFTTVYNVQWYMAPLSIQKMILFLLQRGTKRFYFMNIGLVYVGSLESAGMLVGTAISYFTVVYSIQK